MVSEPWQDRIKLNTEPTEVFRNKYLVNKIVCCHGSTKGEKREINSGLPTFKIRHHYVAVLGFLEANWVSGSFFTGSSFSESVNSI